MSELRSYSVKYVEGLLKENKAAFLAGFGAGAEDAEGGRIIDEDFYREVTEEAYKEYLASLITQ